MSKSAGPFSLGRTGAAFSTALGHPVRMEVVPRDGWERLFRSQGMKNPSPRMRMVDGFNEGWIDFEGGTAESRQGSITLDEVVSQLVQSR